MKRIYHNIGSISSRAKQLSILLLLIGGFTSYVFAQSAFRGVAFEAEAGSRIGNTSVVSDSAASAGSALAYTASTGSCAVATPHVPDGPDGMGGCWPGPSNTGVPAGTTLTNYTGPCTITTPNTVIDSKIINCEILIRANNVTIRKSHIKGNYVGGMEQDGFAFTIEDSFVDNGVCVNCSVDGWNFTLLRTEISGGNRGAYCQHVCHVQDTWIHNTKLDPNGAAHASAIRAEQYINLIHNTFNCSWDEPQGEVGCSADMSGYPDFVPIHHNTIDGNLFMANPEGLGFCAYGGATGGKPFTNDPLNATFVVFKNNVFQRGPQGSCGTWGAITSFDPRRTGNQWTNNKWDDGTPLLCQGEDCI